MAENSLANLECRFFYRLLKVLYFAGLGATLVGLVITGYDAIPRVYTSYKGNRFVICEINIDLNLFREKYPKYNNWTDERLLRVFERKNAEEGVPESNKEWMCAKKTNNQAYKFRMQGSWWEVLYYWLIFPILAYIVLNIIRETLIYLAFGRRFTWDWLKRLRI